MKFRLFFLFFFIKLSVYSQGGWTNSHAFHFRNLKSIAVNDFNHLCIVGGNKTNDSIQTIYISNDAGNTYTMTTDHVSSWVTSVFFTSNSNGITVGAYGKVLKTTDEGNTWNTVSLGGIMSQRHYNNVFFIDALTGYAVGGIQSNDSVSTIIKTTDGGNTWSTLKDNPGYWLASVHFPSAMIGYAVGDHGILYKTFDGGTNWTQKTILGSAGSRNYTSVFFTSNNTGFIVGGNLSNDSIQTILKTNDGGENWTVIRDNFDPMLNDIYFLNPSEGYAVGSKGTVLHSADSGNTWQEVVIPDNNPLYNFNSVRFLNPFYGYIVGDGGIIFRYLEGAGQGPLALTKPASNISSSSVQLNGIVNANNYNTSVIFEYGTSTSYGNTIAGSPSSINDTNDVVVSAELNGLSDNTLYHFRIKATNTMATNYGDDMQFYSGISTIPNFNFEIWDTISMILPDSVDMTGGKITKLSSACHGDYAIRIENDSNSDSPGVILIGKSDNGANFYGGVPFNSRPDSLIGCFDYNIIPNDTALILLILKEQGVVISSNFFKIYGSSATNYETLKFPISYSSPGTPDTIIFGIVSTDFRNQTQILLGSYLNVDYIRFSGTSESIPNYDFENWETYDHVTLNNWWYSRKDRVGEGFGANLPVLISTDSHTGNYAALVRNIITVGDSISGQMSTGSKDHYRFALEYKPNTLTGFYKFYPQNGDSLNISIAVFKNNQILGSGFFKTGNAVLEYTPFMAPIWYNIPETPDSAEINVKVFNNNIPLGNSYAIIDDFNFDGFLAQIEENPYVKAVNADFDFNIYPNPVIDYATINFTLEQPEHILIRLFDISGKEIMIIANKNFEEGNQEFIISATKLQRGLYVCTLVSNNNIYFKKIIVY